MTEESIREIIQGIFLLPENKNSDVKLDDNDLTHSNGIDLSPLITIKVEHDVDRSSANPERTNINNFAPNLSLNFRIFLD